MRRFTAFLLLSAFLLTIVRAQSVHWSNSPSGDPSELQLVFQDCTPVGDPQLPAIDGLKLNLAGTSSQTTINNFTLSRSTILTYLASAQRAGVTVKIPAFTVKTSKGDLRVPAFTGGAPRSAADADISARLSPGATTVWAGEVFSLTYVLDVARRNFSQLGSNVEWTPAPLIVEDWSKPEPLETSANGESRLHIVYKTRGYAKTSGPLTLNATSQLVNIQTGNVGFGFFQAPRVDQVSVASNRPIVVVRPLPDDAPAGFTGAVGQFTFTSKVVPQNAAVGEPVTWTLELSGTGNWPEIAGLPQREVSKDFQVIQPKAKRTPAAGKLFDATLSEDVVLVPSRAGTYPLGPVTFSYFDPKSGAYRTVSTPRVEVTIAPAAAPATAPGSAASSGSATGPTAESQPSHPDGSGAKVPASPEGIPRDPLPGSASASVPLGAGPLSLLLVLPFAGLVIFWGWLALRRARLTDPLRPRREARLRLAATLARLRTATDTERQALLIAWQHDAAALWMLSHAAPPAAALPDTTWAALWNEADRALYSPEIALPADWAERAKAALTARTVPAFSALRLFLPRNLLPFLFTLAVLVVLLPASLHASAASDAYGKGDFAAAAKSWGDVLARHPTDAIARYNLSLALAQQDRWAESAAHASAAFVHEPSSQPIRWQLALACEHAGYVPAPLAGFLPAGPEQSLAQLASPGAWQYWLFAAAIGCALALGVLLFGAYRRPSRRRAWLALSGLGVSLLLAVAAGIALHAYGLSANRRAVIVFHESTLYSIPTEADTTQKTTALPAGTLALEDKTFLGWIRLTFDNGQTGWVRQEDLVPLWK
jgi:hypothetical protein